MSPVYFQEGTVFDKLEHPVWCIAECSNNNY